MEKRKREIGIFLLIILIISTLFPPMETLHVQAEESELQQLQNLNQGEEIIFAGAEWIVLDPAEGYIFSKESIGRRAFDTNRSNLFNPSNTSNLAHYLNGEYYNEAFTPGEQAVIEEKAWEIGGIDLHDDGDESADEVNASIGLLSYREWKEYSKYYNDSNGFLENPGLLMWLRTPDSYNPDPHIWAAWEDGVLRNTRVSYERVAIHPALTLQSDLFVSEDNEVIVPPRQIQYLDQGDEIIFAGTEWIVLDPAEGYIFSKNSIGNRVFDDTEPHTNQFDPEDESHLAYYLNGKYYNEAFTPAEQAVIEPKTWGIGDETNEGAETVEANIGLMSYEEWREYSKYQNSSNGFLDNPNTAMWLRTPNSQYIFDNVVWGVWEDGVLVGVPVTYTHLFVHPALTMKPDLFVSEDNEVIIAGVTFDPNGTGDTWAQAHEIIVNVKFVDMSETVQYAWSLEQEKPSDGWEALMLDENGQSETIQTPEEATGEYYLHIQGKDIFSEDFHLYSQVFKMDNQNPTEPAIHAPDEWTNEEVTVTITAGEDDHSGVNQIEYRLQEAASEDWGDWQTLDDSGELKIATEGETKLEARTVDQAGNQSGEAKAVVKIDQTEPTIAFEPNGDTEAAKEAATQVTVTDALSGVNEDSLLYVWSESDEVLDEEADWEAFANEDELTKIEANGNWYLHIQATDQAGNQVYAVTNPFVLDNTPPELTLHGETEMTIELGASYTEAGAEAIDQQDGDISEMIEITGNVDTSQVGTYPITYTVTDRVGHTASAARTVDVVDTTAPSDVTLEAVEVTTEAVEFTFSAEDLGGINTYILSRDEVEIARIDGGETTYTDESIEAGTKYQYELIAVDASDNTSSPVTVEVFTPLVYGEPVTVEYVDEEGNELASFEELTGKLGESYETEAKEIEGYELIEIPDNASGEFTEAAQTVTYVYALEEVEPILGEPVTVEHVDEEGAELLPPEELIGNIGDSYQTDPADIAGYELQQTPDNAAGTFTNEAQTVVYVYTLVEREIEGTIIIDYVNEAGQSIANRETQTGIVGAAYETEPKTIEGYELVEMPENATGEFTEEPQIVVYIYAPIKEEPASGAPVTVKYVNEEGENLIPSAELIGNIGESYQTEVIEIGGYEVVQTPDNANGKFTSEAQTVIYVYTPVESDVEGTVIIEYVDETGQAIANRETQTGVVGETYETEPKTIEGYELVEMLGNASGEFTEEPQIVVYVYAPIKEEPVLGAPVTVKYVNEEGEDLIPSAELIGNIGESYQTEAIEISGYEMVQTPDNASGTFTEETQTVLYVYASVKVEEPLEGTIMIAYVNKDGQSLVNRETQTGKVGEAYTTEAKEIEGYQLIETPENATGTFTEEVQTVTYVYAPVKPEEPKEPEIPESLEIILDETPVQVFPGILITIKDTQTTIHLPDDLPEGTLLQVLTVQLEEQEGLKQAGEVYDFLFTYPDGQEDYHGDFILTMGVDGTSNQAALYHYQEEWQLIGGNVEGDTITATVSDFSMYGVFMEVETEAEPPVKEESEEKEPRQEPKEQEAEEKEPKQELEEQEEQEAKRKEPEIERKAEKTAEKEATALPATATNQYNWLIAGIILLVLGSGLWFIRQKRKSNEDIFKSGDSM